MATGRMEFHADTIMQHANFCYVLPNDFIMEEIKDPRHYDRPAISLILLHGLTGTDTDWLYGGVAQEMSKQYNLAVFMPTAGNFFYLDRGYDGGNYASFIGDELPNYIRKTFGYCQTRETTIIAGLSMGGFGAIHTALAFPETFSSCIGVSSALVVRGIGENGKGNDDVLPDLMVMDIFGDPADLLMSDKNPEVLYRQLKANGTKIPGIYFAIGTEDSLYGCNQDFRYFLEKENADFFYEEGPGEHNWDFWNTYLPKGIEWAISR
jgi:S-formylglutathione hydrolase FrmB